MSNFPLGLKRASSKALALLLIFTLLFAPLLSVLAQTGDCAGYTCVDVSSFDEDVEGWTASNAETTVSWLESKSFGFFVFTSQADGVLQGSSFAPENVSVKKEVYLQPGEYRIIWRAAADAIFAGLGCSYVLTWVTVEQTTHDLGGYNYCTEFKTYQSNIVKVDFPSNVTIEMSSERSQTLYFDYIWVVASGVVATSTPESFPTLTPLPYTAVPTNMQATSIPTSTPYCVNATATPTPGPGQFGTPSAPTATPDPETGWAILDTFPFGDIDDAVWDVVGNGISGQQNANHSGSTTGVVKINYSDGDQADRTALVHSTGSPIATPFYVDGWVQTDVVPAGETAEIEVWYFDDDTDEWVMAGSREASARNWYPFHVEISTADTVTAIEFTATRSDEPSFGGIWLDDVFMYGSLDNSPHCDGTYPEKITVSNTEPFNDPNKTNLDWPADRPCPPNLTVTNNFFGPLLAAITLFFYQISAGLPTHIPNSITDLMKDLISSPIGTFVTLTGLYVDWTIPFSLVLIALTLEGARWLLSIWPTIRRYIPFL